MLAILEQNSAAEGIGNIQTVLAAEKSLNLAPASIDLALFVDVYHELSWPREIMLDLVDSLKAGGKVVLLEYRAEDPFIQIIPVHKMTSAQVILEMEQVGLELVENGDFLPQQHFLVFRKPNVD
jgi:predicted methyltransferase